MSNQSRGRKKSNFVAQTTIADTDTLDFVTGQTNRKIAFSDFKTQVGAIGTLQQEGAVTGTPVLNQAGDVNNIRNIEAGSGISTSVSPEGGVTVEHNLSQDTVGSPVLVNPTASQPVIASLEAGDGINIVSVDNHIEISTSAVAASTKTIIVNELSDLPTPVADVITLQDDREYLFTNDVNLGINRIVFNNSTIRGAESTLITITYTGTGDMFTAADKTVRVSNCTISCVSGRIWNWSCTALKIIRMNDISITSCDKFGVFNAVDGILRFTNVSPAAITTDGLEFVGDYRSMLWEVSASTVNAGALFNLGVATFDSFIADTILVTLNGSSNLISGAASSANINTGGIGLVNTMRISGTGAPLSGISTNDALWEFRHNDDIPDTRPDALLSMPINATNTVISVATTPVLIAGTWTVERTSQMTGTAAGRATYDGGKDATMPITLSVTLAPVSGTNKDVSLYLAKNGVAISNSRRAVVVSASSPKSVTIPWQDSLEPTDFIEGFVANDSDTVDILCSNAILRLN